MQKTGIVNLGGREGYLAASSPFPPTRRSLWSQIVQLLFKENRIVKFVLLFLGGLFGGSFLLFYLYRKRISSYGTRESRRQRHNITSSPTSSHTSQQEEHIREFAPPSTEFPPQKVWESFLFLFGGQSINQIKPQAKAFLMLKSSCGLCIPRLLIQD